MDYIWRKGGRGGSFISVVRRRYSRAMHYRPASRFSTLCILSLSFVLFSAKICLHLRGRNFLMVARRVVVRYSTRRILRGLHRRCVAMLRMANVRLRIEYEYDITGKSRLIGESAGNNTSRGITSR